MTDVTAPEERAGHMAKLGADLFFLVGRERDAREMRDVFDINFSGSHAPVSSLRLKVSS